MWVRCRYCGRPIRKFLIGWLHLNDGPIGLPTTTPEHLRAVARLSY